MPVEDSRRDACGLTNRIAVVGLGSIGRRHIRTLSSVTPDIEIIGVRYQNRQNWPEESLVSMVVPNHLEAVSNQVDAAIICSPASRHAEDAVAYLDAGLPVLIEKPLALSVEDTALLTQNLASRPPVLVGYTFRYSDGMHFITQWLSSGNAGRIIEAHFVARSFLPDWRPGQDYRYTVSASSELGGGVLLELSHEIDMAFAFLGPLTSLSATLSSSGILDVEVEDTAHLRLKSAQGVPIDIDLDFHSRVPSRVVSIRGEKENLSWDLLTNSAKITSASWALSEISFNDSRDDHFSRQLEHFLACASGQEAPRVTLMDGINVLRVVDAARRSSQNDSEVSL